MLSVWRRSSTHRPILLCIMLKGQKKCVLSLWRELKLVLEKRWHGLFYNIFISCFLLLHHQTCSNIFIVQRFKTNFKNKSWFAFIIFWCNTSQYMSVETSPAYYEADQLLLGLKIFNVISEWENVLKQKLCSSRSVSNIFFPNGGLICERSTFETLWSETRSFPLISYIEIAVTTRSKFYRKLSDSLAHSLLLTSSDKGFHGNGTYYTSLEIKWEKNRGWDENSG